MRFSFFIRPAATMILAGTAVLACSSDTAMPPAYGVLSVALTDAPFPVDSVDRADLYVIRIDAKLASPDDSDANDDFVIDSLANADPAKGWVTIATPDRIFNLLDLQAGRTANLGERTLPTGMYRGFRLILDTEKSSITLKDGTILSGANGKIKFPSAAQTGIKINLAEPITLVADGTQMIVDFDLGKSFVLRGNSIATNGLLFKPVIRGTARDITGRISGVVHLVSATGAVAAGSFVEILKENTSVTDTSSVNLVATAITDTTGAYTVDFLLPEKYAVRVVPADTMTYGKGFVPEVVVVTGETTQANIVLPELP